MTQTSDHFLYLDKSHNLKDVTKFEKLWANGMELTEYQKNDPVFHLKLIDTACLYGKIGDWNLEKSFKRFVNFNFKLCRVARINRSRRNAIIFLYSLLSYTKFVICMYYTYTISKFQPHSHIPLEVAKSSLKRNNAISSELYLAFKDVYRVNEVHKKHYEALQT